MLRASISLVMSSLGAFRILHLRTNTFCIGKMPPAAFSISLPIESCAAKSAKTLSAQPQPAAASLSTSQYCVVAASLPHKRSR